MVWYTTKLQSGVNDIYNESLKINGIFDNVIVSVSKKLMQLELEAMLQEEVKEDNVITVTMESKGVFNSKIYCYMEKDLVVKMINDLTRGEPILEGEIDLYLKEYLNVICGRAISEINNIVGVASRFSVPDIFQGYKETEDCYEQKEEFMYGNEFGMLKLIVIYMFEENKKS